MWRATSVLVCGLAFGSTQPKYENKCESEYFLNALYYVGNILYLYILILVTGIFLLLTILLIYKPHFQKS